MDSQHAQTNSKGYLIQKKVLNADFEDSWYINKKQTQVLI